MNNYQIINLINADSMSAPMTHYGIPDIRKINEINTEARTTKININQNFEMTKFTPIKILVGKGKAALNLL